MDCLGLELTFGYILFEKFLILRRIQRDIIIHVHVHVHRSLREVAVFGRILVETESFRQTIEKYSDA